MKLKKKVRRALIIFLILLACLVGFLIFRGQKEKPKEVKEVKVINEVKTFGYTLKENKPAEYKKMFEELKEILNTEPIDEEKYTKKIFDEALKKSL